MGATENFNEFLKSKDEEYLLMGRTYVDSRNYGAQEDQSTGGGMTKRKWKRPSIK